MRNQIRNFIRGMPFANRILRPIYRRVSGRMLDEKFENIAMKLDHLEMVVKNSGQNILSANLFTFLIENSFKTFATSQPYHEDALAVVSVLPPERTGVAHFTLEAFIGAEYPIDFYCPHFTTTDYLALSARMASGKGRHRLLPLDLLPYGLSTRFYSACVFVLGNSEHHMPIYQALKQWGRMGKPSIVHLHDPCLWNLVAFSRPDDSIANILRTSYPELAPPPGNIAVEEALRLGALGSRVLLDSIDLHGVIVNSLAAGQLLAAELPNRPIRTVFHPIFANEGQRKSLHRQKLGPLRVGSFGIPSQEKCTDTVLAAFAELRRHYPDSELILAGYHAATYARASSLGAEQGIHAIEPQGVDELMALMVSCDVAVQLRRRNLGESSGIIAQLMSVGTPVIATDIGSFREYRGAVWLMPAGSTPEQIATAMMEEAGNRDMRADAVNRLVEERSPAHFSEVFRDAVQALRGTITTEP